MSHEYESEVTGSRHDVAAVLGSVVDGIAAGTLQLSDEDEDIVVEIPDELTLDVEVEIEDDDLSLELELEWSHPDIEVEPPADPPTNDAESAIPVGPAAPSATLARFEVFRDRRDEWRWRLRHRNGNVIATSGEGYTRKHNAQKGLESVVRNAPDAEITDDSGREHSQREESGQ